MQDIFSQLIYFVRSTPRMDVSRKKIPVMHMTHTIDMYVTPPIRLSLSINEEKV